MYLQKAFDTVDHQIQLAKLNHYGIRGVLKMIGLNLSNRSQYVSINGYESSLTAINCGVPQGICSRTPAIVIIYKRPESSNKILQSSPLC